MQTLPLISVTNLTYTRPQWGIRDLSFTVNRGECMAFIGKNGTGKTTLLNLLAGLIKPHAGHILIQGFNIHTLPILAKQFMGFLPDQCPLYSELTVREYLNFIAKLRKISKSDISDRLEEALEKLNLKQNQHHLIGILSKGLKQRVGLASVILHRPAVLLLDEPTQGLDQNQIEDFQFLLSEYKKNAAIILSTHYLNEVKSICDHALQFSTEGIKDYDFNYCPA
jgi:ABC-2 type transport system ATP-binding protein